MGGQGFDVKVSRIVIRGAGITKLGEESRSTSSGSNVGYRTIVEQHDTDKKRGVTALRRHE